MLGRGSGKRRRAGLERRKSRCWLKKRVAWLIQIVSNSETVIKAGTEGENMVEL